ncbi:MAG: DUF983 domain-containing protein [Pseudomonadota bacterium]
MKHASDIEGETASSGPPSDDGRPRDLGRALRRGWRGVCPACGGGPLYGGYLAVRPRCLTCGEELERHRADDAPAWVTIMIVGHVIGVALLASWDLALPMWVHWVVWPPLTLALTLLLLPRVKGMIVGLQWARRMAGFDRSAED